MTEMEAQRILNEHRALPIFVRGRYRYVVREIARRGRTQRVVDIYRLSASGKRGVFSCSTTDKYLLHPDVWPHLNAEGR